MNRIRAGFCVVRNPFRPSQTWRVELNPQDVKAIFFWTRWPGPLLPHLAELDERGYNTVFHVTITGLPRLLEPHPVDEATRIEALHRLASIVGRKRVWWRYDPVFLGERLDLDFHLGAFKRLADQLAPSTDRVTLSLVDWYRKTTRRMSSAEAQVGPLFRLAGTEPEVLELIGGLAQIARDRGIEPVSCSEAGWEAVGLSPGACIDAEAANRLFGLSVKEGKDPGQRPLCRCSPSFDIGTTDSCVAGCVYCYATVSHERACRCRDEHDPSAVGLF